MKKNRKSKCDKKARPVPLGCWALGGPFMRINKSDGCGSIDNAESMRTIDRAVDIGANFFLIG